MKTLKPLIAIVTAYLLLMVQPAWSAEKVLCSVTYTTGVAGVTSSPTTGSCSWSAGSNVLMQCTTDVYFNYQVVDGALAAATSADAVAGFASNTDPIPVCLSRLERHISFLGVTASGTCKFMQTSFRRCPR